MPPEYKDEQLICVECELPWLFTASEQRFYESKMLTVPKRCPDCRQRRKLMIRRDDRND